MQINAVQIGSSNSLESLQVGLLAAVAQLMSGEQITGVIALVAVSTCKRLLKIVNNKGAETAHARAQIPTK